MKKQTDELKLRIDQLEQQITESRRLSESEKAMKAAIDEMVEGIQVVTFDWRYLYLNKAALLHAKLEKEQLIGQTMMESYPGIEQTSVFKEIQKTMSDRKVRQMENEFTYADGSKGWYWIHIEPHSSGVLIRSLDITDRKKIEAQLLHSQKLETIGHLSGSIAHDFCNKLSIMKIYCESLLESDPEDAIAKAVRGINNAVNKSTALTKQLVLLSRKQTFSFKKVNLNDLVKESIEGLDRLLGPEIKIRLSLADNQMAAYVDPSQIDQALLNMYINARHAMPDGGNLTITTSQEKIDEHNSPPKPQTCKPGNYIKLSVADTGTGISKEIMHKVFEPFFTTKDAKNGTGLGLSTTLEILKKSKGFIKIENNASGGAVFHLYFPEYDDDFYAEEPQELMPVDSINGKETFLLLEDDSSLRNALSQGLKNFGYTVLSAANIQEAENIFAKNKDEIKVIISDLVIPGQNVRVLISKFLEQNPNLKVIHISGYDCDEILSKEMQENGHQFLQKPFSISSLLTIARSLLDNKNC